MAAIAQAGKALLATIKGDDPSTAPPPVHVPQDVQKRVDRARKAMRRGHSMRRLCSRFERGDSYWYINKRGLLTFQDTTLFGGEKPPHRVRNKYNLIKPIVQGKVSQASQRIPGFQVVPSKADPGTIFAAELSRKTLIYGVGQWNLRRALIKTLRRALIQDGGYAYPFFDTQIGPFIESTDPDTGEVERVGQGDIRVVVLSGSEVGWEPGEDFYDSRWHVIERVRPIDEVKAMPGYVGGPLDADSTTGDLPTDRQETEDKVRVTEYLERPSEQNPDGRRLVIANKRVICKPSVYPLRDHEDKAVDEVLLHPLWWTTDEDDNRQEQGLVESLIDLQRGAQDCLNKITEWKNRALMPRMLAPRGSKINRNTEEPGGVVQYNPTGAQPPQWEVPAKIPPELFSFYQLLVQQMRDLAADTVAQADANLAAATVQAVVEQNEQRWQTFMADVADWWSGIGRHCLYLVARYYTEDRLLALQGSFGPDLEEGFRGADLLGQADVRVAPESLTLLTQEAVEQRATNWAQLGWITPTAAMRAIDSGTTDGLMQGYEDDVGRIWQVVALIKQGPDVLFSMPRRWDPYAPATIPGTTQPVVNPMTGQPQVGAFVPAWMPRRFDDPDVQIEVLVAWMKGNEFARLDPGMQEAAYAVYDALTQEQQRRQVQQAVQQTQMAQGLGMQNAAQPQLGKPMPSLPAVQQGGQNGA